MSEEFKEFWKTPALTLEPFKEKSPVSETKETDPVWDDTILSEEEKRKFDLYFGFDICKTPEEIRRIYEVSHDIWDNCEHLIRKYPFGVYKTYEQYQKNYDFEKLYTLTQSLGKGFWNI